MFHERLHITGCVQYAALIGEQQYFHQIIFLFNLWYNVNETPVNVYRYD